MHCCFISSNHIVPAISTHIRSHPDILLSVKTDRDVGLGAVTIVTKDVA